MTLTVKHQPAGFNQAGNLRLLCQIAQQMGANRSQMAGAMATMIQESDAINMQGGDRDSAGLFQQRPSQGWGSYAQVTDPTYAIKKFLTPYLAYCRQGMAIFTASDKVQGSQFPQAPAQWYSESVANVNEILSGKDFGDATSSGLIVSGSTQVTRSKPYEFSRGTAGAKETSWDCIGRLAQEVNWDRFMRSGALWFVSETWLRNQAPRFAFAQGTRGVTAISFDADSRRNASEMTVTALAKRWSVLPGDVVIVSGQGPGDGTWLVSDTRRTLWDDSTEITLKRPAAPKPEPANETTTTTVAGQTAMASAALGSAPEKANAVYQYAQKMSAMHIPYSKTQRTLVPNPPSADCSSSCSWVLWMAGFHLPGGVSGGGWAPVSGQFESWGVAGEGKYFTVWCSSEHIWLRFHGFPMWRFDTSPHGDGPDGPQLRKSPRSTATFVARHWPDL